MSIFPQNVNTMLQKCSPFILQLEVDFSEFLHRKTQHPITDVMSVSHNNNELILHIFQVLFDKRDINSIYYRHEDGMVKCR